jgi:hypothetical protein
MTIDRGASSPLGQVVCSIAPPDILVRVVERGNRAEREAAITTLVETAALRAQRNVISSLVRDLNVGIADLAFMEAPATAVGKRRTVYDAQHGGAFTLPGLRGAGRGRARGCRRGRQRGLRRIRRHL